MPMRMLKIAVVVMGVLILGGTATLVTLLVRRAMPAAPTATPNLPPALLDEPAGTRIAGASALADRVVLRLQGGGPDRVVVVDLRSGRVVGRIGLAR
ncbi:MAG: hypothetical protein KGL55_13820 [Rhodospirillales bacterium]|nr:hypothetical protein [Rhodospirillales bacterium]MDE2576380.1 hypothetical protein [Rhodospirillales bacterium]